MNRKSNSGRRLKGMGIWILILSLFISELLGYTWSRVQCIGIGYEISRGNEKRARLVTVQKNLTIELARLRSPERIARIARERLGLITPKPDQVIIVQ
jgi:cell division protein FtsL